MVFMLSLMVFQVFWWGLGLRCLCFCTCPCLGAPSVPLVSRQAQIVSQASKGKLGLSKDMQYSQFQAAKSLHKSTDCPLHVRFSCPKYLQDLGKPLKSARDLGSTRRVRKPLENTTSVEEACHLRPLKPIALSLTRTL